ncbi:MAG: Fic family protein [Solirubrobacterales bacterium]
MADNPSRLAGARSGELIIPSDTDRAKRLADAGSLRRVSHGLYTENLGEPIERVVRRNWLQVLGLRYPGSVLVGRSAILAKPTDGGHLYLDAGDRRSVDTVEVGPLKIVLRSGPGPLPGDTDLSGVFLSSRARIALDNLIESRDGNAPSWTVGKRELEDWLTNVADRHGESELNQIRDDARMLADQQGGEWRQRFTQLDELIGSILGTREAHLLSQRAAARRGGLAYDSVRVDRFDLLRTELLASAPRGLSVCSGVTEVAAFYESYFSNYIEGTEFTLEEAGEIIFDGKVPADRPEDAHDIIGTFLAANDSRRNAATPVSADDLVATAKELNVLVLERRPDKRPGEFKERANQAGATVFVEPELVEGTLRAGWSYYESLPAGFARAVFMMFLIAEVHPFADGNGRTARLMMNSELTAEGLCRFIVPISYRDDYLGALRALSRTDRPVPLVRMVTRILQWVGQVDWSGMPSAKNDLEAVAAFDDAADARLRIP